MHRERLIQLFCFVIAACSFWLSGQMLPPMNDVAGEPYLRLTVDAPTDSAGLAVVKRRVPISKIYSMETTHASEQGEVLQVGYDGGLRIWDGRIGDSIKLQWRTSEGEESGTARVDGRGGYGLRYTDEAVAGSPPIVALGTALGALRGLIVDYLWLKVTWMKEKGLFYEVMADADLITRLQPRFPEVWAFHGHNMAYNISVVTNTPEERWAWVNAGIDLVRNRGIRYNPNDLVLHKELAFWFAHKLDGVADDAHLHYKREFAREWQFVLGTPPYDYEQRKEWIKRIADAPVTITELEKVDPEMRAFLDRLEAQTKILAERYRFDPTGDFKRFLMLHGEWDARRSSAYAKLLGMRPNEEAAPSIAALDATFGDPAFAKQAAELLDFMRRRVLLDDYNMDPRLMFEYTRDTGPLDWRHPQAHALYWARRGEQFGQDRVEKGNDIYKTINNSRVEIQAMQALARSGLVGYDPFSGDNVTRLNDPRWIKVIDRKFRRLYDQYYTTRGSGSDSFTDFHENFMKGAIRELYRSGDVEGAQAILDELDGLYGRGGVVPNEAYAIQLDTFVRNVTYGEYEQVPETARSDVYAALERGFREGLLLDRKEVLDDALRFANELTTYFREARWNDFVNKFGEGRMRELLGGLDESVSAVLVKVLTDSNTPLLDRFVIYGKSPEDLRAAVYDRVKPQIEMEFAGSRLASSGLTVDRVLPEPPGLDEYRRLAAARAAAREAERNDADRSAAQRK
ncbi:MAG: hypothetical protein EXS10_02865 [Phycisphaerales bacterium]|nr:hypothetical protein [Phycisphaerales bacterium]